MASVEDEVLGFLAWERGMNKSEIQPDDTLMEDLGMDGDDAVDFFKSFAKKFNVNLDDLTPHWRQHFGGEAIFFGGRKIPITVHELIQSAVAGRWIKTYGPEVSR